MRRSAVEATAAVACLIGLAALPAAGQEVRLRPGGAIYLDAAGAGLSRPEAVATDGGSALIVADTGNRRLLRYRITDDRVAPAGEIRLDQLTYPTRVAVDSAGRIFALDGRSHRIVRIDAGGGFGGFVDLDSAGGSEPLLPRSFLVDDQGRLWVLDAAGQGIVVLDGSGAVSRRIALDPEVGFVSDLAIGPAGVVFAVDSVRKRVLAARSADTALAPLGAATEGRFTFPTAIAIDAAGRLFVADRSAGRLVVLEASGVFVGRYSAPGWKEGFLRHPSGLAVAPGRLFVADRDNNRVQIFDIAE